MLNKKRLEADNQVVNQINKLLEKFKERLTLDNLRLSERYIKGEIRILIHFRFTDKEYVAIFQRLSDVGGADCVSSTSGDCDLPSPDANDCNEQSMVLIGNVQFVENPKHVCSTLIRVGSVNCIYSTLRHALYSSMSLGMVFRGTIPDGEGGLLGMGRTGGVNELIGEMVKGTSEVVNNISGNKSDFGGRGLEFSHVKDVISRMRIIVGLNDIGVSLDEPIPRDFQVTDVLFGAFNFYADERKSVVSSHEDSP